MLLLVSFVYLVVRDRMIHTISVSILEGQTFGYRVYPFPPCQDRDNLASTCPPGRASEGRDCPPAMPPR